MKKNRGLTIIEMLVAMIIFSLVVGSTMGLFVSAIRTQRKFLATQKLLDETSYVMEYMGRGLRMAKKDETGDCITACSTPPIPGYNYSYPYVGVNLWIRFLDYRGRCHQFGHGEGWTGEGELIKRIVEWVSATDFTAEEICTDFAPDLGLYNNYLTSENLTIPVAGPYFSIKGEAETDNLQPRVTIVFELAKMPELNPSISIQTTISQRDLDI